MRESIKTLVFLLVAAGLAITASVVEPESATPKILSDQGEDFYPQFKDAQAVKTIEVVDYDESTATTRPFQVESQNGRWVLSSNNNYPVDIGDSPRGRTSHGRPVTLPDGWLKDPDELIEIEIEDSFSGG